MVTLTKTASGLLYRSDGTLAGWSGQGQWTSFAVPFFVAFDPMSIRFLGPEGHGAGHDEAGTREGQLYIEDGIWYLIYDSWNSAEYTYQALARSTDRGLTWERLGAYPSSRVDAAGATLVGVATGWLEKWGGTYYRHRVACKGVTGGASGNLVGGPYTWDVWSSPSLLPSATWTPEQVVPLGGWAPGNLVPGNSIRDGTTYRNFCSAGSLVGRYSAPSPAGPWTPEATTPTLPGTPGHIPENSRAFYSAALARWVALANCYASTHTDLSSCWASTSLTDWSGSTRWFIQQVSPMDGLGAVGTMSHISTPDGGVVVGPGGEIPCTYDGDPTGNDEGWHVGRKIKAVVLEPSLACLRYAGSGDSVLRVLTRSLNHGDFVAEWACALTGATAGTGGAGMDYRLDGTGAGYRLFATSGGLLTLSRLSAGSATTLATGTGQLIFNINYVVDRFKVSVQGARHRAWLNGELQIDFTDPSPTVASGTMLGLVGQQVVAEFRNVSVRSSDRVTITGLYWGEPCVVRSPGGLPVARLAAGADGAATHDWAHYPVHALDVRGTDYLAEGGIWGGDQLAFSGLPATGLAVSVLLAAARRRRALAQAGRVVPGPAGGVLLAAARRRRSAILAAGPYPPGAPPWLLLQVIKRRRPSFVFPPPPPPPGAPPWLLLQVIKRRRPSVVIPPPPPPPAESDWYPTPNNVGGALASAHTPGGPLALAAGQGALLASPPSHAPTGTAPLILTVTGVNAATTPATLTPLAVLEVTDLAGDTIPADGYAVLWGADGSWAAGTRVEILLTDEHFEQVRLRIDELESSVGAIPATTTDLAEGSNLYFTPARADARVNAFGVVHLRPSGGDDRPAIRAAMAAAGTGVVRLSEGVFRVAATLDLAGMASALQGIGDGTTIRHLPGQTGPVISFDGYLPPEGFETTREFGGFTVEGDGTAGPAKVGIFLNRTVGIAFRDIAVRNTGGPCWDLLHAEFCHFDNIICKTPVDAATGNIAYILLRGATNGNRFTGLGLRSRTTGADTGVDGALRMATFVETDGVGYNPNSNTFSGCWIEFLHAVSGGCLVKIEGNQNSIESFQLFDNTQVVGATNTCFYRFANPPAGAENLGGNILWGLIPGSFTDPGALMLGVEVLQSGNRIDGIKGYNGSNVRIAPGVRQTLVLLGGTSNLPAGVAVADDSGNDTNVVLDLAAQSLTLPGAASRLQVQALAARQLATGLQFGAGSYLSAGVDGSTGAPGNWIFLRNTGDVTSYAGAGVYIQNTSGTSTGSSYLALDRSRSDAAAAVGFLTGGGLEWSFGAHGDTAFSTRELATGYRAVVVEPGSPTHSVWTNPDGVRIHALLVRPDGSLQPPHLADTAAAADSIYYSTTAGSLCYKDPAGTVHPLY